MNFSDALTSYTAELVDIMQEVQAKIQRPLDLLTHPALQRYTL
jgi:hypothetical protein